LSLGATDQPWMSFTLSAFTFLEIVFGQWEIDPFLTDTLFAGPILFLMTLFLANLVLMNVFIAVVGNVYEANLKSSEEQWSNRVIDGYQYDVTESPPPATTGNPILSCYRGFATLLRSAEEVIDGEGDKVVNALPERIMRPSELDRIMRASSRAKLDPEDDRLNLAMGRMQEQLDEVTAVVRNMESQFSKLVPHRDAASLCLFPGEASASSPERLA